MSKKGGNFFEVYIEAHIEKIIIGVIGIICVWLLITHVLLSPNRVEYDGNKLGVGDVDRQINRQADDLRRRKLDIKPESTQQYKPKANDFTARIESPFRNTGEGIYFPQPGNRPAIEISYGRKYRLPVVGSVSDILAGYIRAVVYMPTQNIDEENTYDKVGHEPNDLDFVTVEAKFDTSVLYENFQKSFNGTDMPEEWRDPCLAKPVFAAVQLERQELGADGNWSDWKVVPRTKIDPYSKMFEVIEDIDELPAGGIKVRLLQFDNPWIRMDMLQPEAYKIASAEEMWYPPSLYEKFMKYQAAVKAQEKQEEMEAKKQEQEKQLEEHRKQTPAPRPAQGQRPTGILSPAGIQQPAFGRSNPQLPTLGITRSGTGVMGALTRRTDTGASRITGGTPTQPLAAGQKSEKEDKQLAQRKKEAAEAAASLHDIDEELKDISLTENTDFGKMQKPVVFWAHDDTVEAEKTYRYRLRLGVFNPIAGSTQVVEQDKQQKDKVILWSEFSEPSEIVGIPPRLCLFARDAQGTAKSVTVMVSRYVLGYWYSTDFTVKAGDTIGDVRAPEPAEPEKGLKVPEQIDYTTGAVLIDVVQVDDWSGGINPYKRQYYDMLYTFDGTSVEHMAAKQKYWPEKVQTMYVAIKKSEKEPKQPLRPFGTQLGEPRRGTMSPGMMPPGMGPPGKEPPPRMGP